MSNVTPLDARAATGLGEWAELLARISHDLRTPLNAVIGFSDAMQHELFGPLGNSRYQEYARHIRQSGHELLKATESTLAMTSLLTAQEAVRMEDLQLATLIGEAVAEQAVAASILDCSFDVRLAGNLCNLDVRGDPRLLPRAVRYLMSAVMSRAVSGSTIAIEATGVHGQITLQISVSPVRETAVTRPHSSAEAGLGRDEMALWLARGLLERHGSAMSTGTTCDAFRVEIELELAMQQDFFPRM